MPSRWCRFDRTLKRIADEEPTGLLEWLAEVLYSERAGQQSDHTL